MTHQDEPVDVTAVLAAHREGTMIGTSLRSFLDAAAVARDGGLSVQLLAVLDLPDEDTRAALGRAKELGIEVTEVDCGDHAGTRMEGIAQARGDYVAIHDGDDLWTENWLLDGHRMCQTEPGRVIAHPEVDWFFDRNNSLYFIADQTDPGFDPAILRFANLWDSMCMAPRALYDQFPYTARDLAHGFAYEDWHWNMDTLAAGYVHRAVPDTVHFKRRRTGSQYMQARANRSLPRRSALHSYEWHRSRA